MTTALILLVIFAATLLRSSFGFGDALLAMPLLAMLIDMKTGTPLVAMVASTIALVILFRQWRQVHLAGAWRLILSSMLGIPLGLWLLTRGDDLILKIILGLGITIFSLYKIFHPRLFHLATERSAWIFGFVGGVLGGACNTNGPAIVVYGTLRGWAPPVFRATLQGYFLPVGLMIVAGHLGTGLWSGSVIRLYAMSLPLVLLGIWLGGHLNRRIAPERFEKQVYLLLATAGLLLLWQTLPG
jgi:uncharacterized protein